jgi:hypothetical protein
MKKTRAARPNHAHQAEQCARAHCCLSLHVRPCSSQVVPEGTQQIACAARVQYPTCPTGAGHSYAGCKLLPEWKTTAIVLTTLGMHLAPSGPQFTTPGICQMGLDAQLMPEEGFNTSERICRARLAGAPSRDPGHAARACAAVPYAARAPSLVQRPTPARRARPQLCAHLQRHRHHTQDPTQAPAGVPPRPRARPQPPGHPAWPSTLTPAATCCQPGVQQRSRRRQAQRPTQAPAEAYLRPGARARAWCPRTAA